VSRKLRGIKSAERDSTWQKERDGDRERGNEKKETGSAAGQTENDFLCRCVWAFPLPA